MTCGAEVFDRKQQGQIAQQIQEQLAREGKDHLSPADADLLLQKAQAQQLKAEQFKNRLLEYDRSSARRTKVIGFLLSFLPILFPSFIL